ncbi:glutamine-hydrolyzing carbamoyl-phosphate synthase small subunit [Micrococcoides hystricis]|uniref:Carbamoyl phosphate synthase small chain n=1 Tax=Micrococcoides hystricis TaxID=1572761 RepID=A0ABV6P8Y0_9MICC
MNTQNTSRQHRPQALLVLADGRTFAGRAFGANTTSFGEVNFNTAMSGYQEALTDPASAGTMITLTFPHIGNTGMNTEDAQSTKVWAAGLIVRELSRRPSNWRSETSLEEDLAAQGITGIEGIDTRALTHHIRDHGVMNAGIFVGEDAAAPVAELTRKVADTTVDTDAYRASAAGAQARTLTATDLGLNPDEVSGPAVKVAVLDNGVKKSDLLSLARRGAELTVLSADAGSAEVTEAGVAGVFVSDGPGTPEQLTERAETVKELIEAGLPVFGVGLGQLIIGMAAGVPTTRLAVGHHGANQPVTNTATGKVEITAQSHQYALDIPAGTSIDGVAVTYRSLNDGVVEGIELADKAVFATAFHPEGAGPLDAASNFDRFVELLTARTGN